MTAERGVLRWRFGLPARRFRPLRMLFVVAGMPRTLWLTFYLLVPVAVLVLTGAVVLAAPAVDVRPLAGTLVVVCACLTAATWAMASGWRDVSYELDPSTARLRVTVPPDVRTATDESPFTGSETVEDALRADLADVESVAFVRLSGFAVGRVDYGGWVPQNPYVVVVPDEDLDRVVTALRAVGVAVSPDPGQDDARRRLRNSSRYVPVAWSCVVFLVPVGAVLYAVSSALLA